MEPSKLMFIGAAVAVVGPYLGYTVYLGIRALCMARDGFGDWFFEKHVRPPRFGLRTVAVGVFAFACVFASVRARVIPHAEPREEWTVLSSLGLPGRCDCGKDAVGFFVKSSVTHKTEVQYWCPACQRDWRKAVGFGTNATTQEGG